MSRASTYEIGHSLLRDSKSPSKSALNREFLAIRRLPTKEAWPLSEPEIRQWHDRLIDKAARLLARRNVIFDPLQASDGALLLRIAPIPEISALNEFAHRCGERLDGLCFLYSPKDLVRRDTDDGRHRLRKARSLYQREKHTILIPDRAIATGRVDDAIHHEVLHAEFNTLLRHGVASLFHGWFKSAQEHVAMWNSSKYRFRMSLEELATHSVNLRFLGEELLTAWVDGDRQHTRTVLARLIRKAATLQALAFHTEVVLRDVLTRFGQIHWHFTHEDLRPITSGKGTLQRVVWTETSLDRMQIKIPLVAPAEGLLPLLALRLETLAVVSGRLAECTRQLLGALADTQKKTPLWAGDLPLVTALAGIAAEPQALTDPYIRWSSAMSVA